jgi:NitT/TauT family transport system substrate-binding protein
MNLSSAKFILALLIFLVALSGCGPSGTTAPAMIPITVQLRWTHQAQFAGFYAADQRGYYAAEGLSVNFIERKPKANLYQRVLDGTAQFGVAGADTLLVLRAQEKPLRAIATIYRRSPVIFFAKADSGITRPEDFIGKTIQVSEDFVFNFQAMMARIGIRPGQYSAVNYGIDLTPFHSGKVHVWSGNIFGNPVFTVQRTGQKLVYIYPDDYGVHFYSDTLYTTDDFTVKNPGLVKRFLRATLKGWTYAVENPNAITPMVAKYNPDVDTAYETASMIASIPLVNTGEDYIGWMKPEMWVEMGKTLRERGVLKKPVDTRQAYTLQFLKEIYKK